MMMPMRWSANSDNGGNGGETTQRRNIYDALFSAFLGILREPHPLLLMVLYSSNIFTIIATPIHRSRAIISLACRILRAVMWHAMSGFDIIRWIWDERTPGETVGDGCGGIKVFFCSCVYFLAMRFGVLRGIVISRVIDDELLREIEFLFCRRAPHARTQRTACVQTEQDDDDDDDVHNLIVIVCRRCPHSDILLNESLDEGHVRVAKSRRQHHQHVVPCSNRHTSPLTYTTRFIKSYRPLHPAHTVAWVMQQQRTWDDVVQYTSQHPLPRIRLVRCWLFCYTHRLWWMLW